MYRGSGRLERLMTDHLVEGGGQLIQIGLDLHDGLVKSSFRVDSSISLNGDDDKVVQRMGQLVTSISDRLILQKLPKFENTIEIMIRIEFTQIESDWAPCKAPTYMRIRFPSVWSSL